MRLKYSLCVICRGFRGGGGEQMICITALELLLCFSSLLRFDLLPLNYCVGGGGGRGCCDFNLDDYFKITVKLEPWLMGKCDFVLMAKLFD